MEQHAAIIWYVKMPHQSKSLLTCDGTASQSQYPLCRRLVSQASFSSCLSYLCLFLSESFCGLSAFSAFCLLAGALLPSTSVFSMYFFWLLAGLPNICTIYVETERLCFHILATLSPLRVIKNVYIVYSFAFCHLM